jgi:hypothetical protein
MQTPANPPSESRGSSSGSATLSHSERAGALLAPFGVRPPERVGQVVRIEVNDAHMVIAAMRALDGEGLKTGTLAVRDPSLDDVFLFLTGRPAETTEESTETPTRGAA